MNLNETITPQTITKNEWKKEWTNERTDRLQIHYLTWGQNTGLEAIINK